jgi:hypothetical protein
MTDFLIGMAFVAMVLCPAIVASLTRKKASNGEL